MKHTLYAHSLPDKAPCYWQSLEDHLKRTAQLASSFGEAFNSTEWTGFLGQLHDIGKARSSFQQYLLRSNNLAEEIHDDFSDHAHSGCGSCYVEKKFPGRLGRLLAYSLAGHHAGLPDWIGGNASLYVRLEREKKQLEDDGVRKFISKYEKEWEKICPHSPPWNMKENDIALWIRMLFSCLTDADFLDTESFMDLNRNEQRKGYKKLAELSEIFFKSLEAFQLKSPPSEINSLRSEISRLCRNAAELPPGLFSLTVPTGGGKTLSGLAFALRHALLFEKPRIIYIIPYTSIIEQTADILKNIFGADQILEHHANFSPEKETPRSRLASENWDAPIVITTTVQFFESLYSSKPGRCRKLHNISNSVVILDEVQLLPPRLLLPCSEILKQLALNYKTTVLLTTATQPELPGLGDVREIIPPEMNLFEKLKRTDIEMPTDTEHRCSWEEVAGSLTRYDQVLCVVNTRKDCRALWKLMPPGTIHLSAAMCGEHRSKTIQHIKSCLQNNMPVRVISTQLVEAGVDIDFPVVFRAMAGLPSIAQAAGRCNREGRLRSGKVVVFMPPKPSPAGELLKGENTVLIDMLPEGIDMEDPNIFPDYFKKFYSRINDRGEIFKTLLSDGAKSMSFQFREADENFRMIENQDMLPVIVRYHTTCDDKRIDDFLDTLRQIGPTRDIMRRLQRYSVNIPADSVKKWYQEGIVEEIAEGIFVQCENCSDLYNETFGVNFSCNGFSVEDLNI